LIQKPEEIVHLQTDRRANARDRVFVKKGWTFGAAFEEVIERLIPDDQIRALHTRAIANGGNWYLSSVGSY
jgi:hypothetical protein